jgi:hypothetical protein
MSPSVCASGAAARSAERARLSALHRGSRQAVTPDSAPGRVSWNRRVQTGGPSPTPVQRAPRGPVIVPDERGPEAARERTVSVRARAPRPLRAIRSTLMMASLRPAGGALVSKYGSRRQARGRRRDAAVRVSCCSAIHLSDRTTIREAMAECGHARRSRFHSERFANRLRAAWPTAANVARMERSVIRDCHEASTPPRISLRSIRATLACLRQRRMRMSAIPPAARAALLIRKPHGPHLLHRRK